MKDKIILYGIIIMLGIVIGYLLYPVFNKSPVPQISVPPDSSSNIGEPDTVWMPKDSVIYRPYVVYRDTGSITIAYDQSHLGLKIPRAENMFWSYEKFNPNKYVTSEVYALAPDSVKLFMNDVAVNWDLHYNDVYVPKIEVAMGDERRHTLIKGLAAGALFAGSVATGDWKIAAGGLVLASGIIIIF